MNRVIVHREDGTRAEVLVTKRDDSWQVKTPVDDEFWRFVSSSASKRTVGQLIRKKWCSRYNVDPDDFSDRD